MALLQIFVLLLEKWLLTLPVGLIKNPMALCERKFSGDWLKIRLKDRRSEIPSDFLQTLRYKFLEAIPLLLIYL